MGTSSWDILRVPGAIIEIERKIHRVFYYFLFPLVGFTHEEPNVVYLIKGAERDPITLPTLSVHLSARLSHRPSVTIVTIHLKISLGS